MIHFEQTTSMLTIRVTPVFNWVLAGLFIGAGCGLLIGSLVRKFRPLWVPAAGALALVAFFGLPILYFGGARDTIVLDRDEDSISVQHTGVLAKSIEGDAFSKIAGVSASRLSGSRGASAFYVEVRLRDAPPLRVTSASLTSDDAEAIAAKIAAFAGL